MVAANDDIQVYVDDESEFSPSGGQVSKCTAHIYWQN